MMLKILTVVAFLKICAGDVNYNSKSQADHAVSTQSFERHDVPLSYKFSAVHDVYTTQNPAEYLTQSHLHHNPQYNVSPPKEIQYAPIYNAQSEQSESYGKDSSKTNAQDIPGDFKVHSIGNKPHLEPQPQKVKQQQPHLAYVPGYNIEVLQAVNKYPGHNAVYRSYPHMSANEKINKVNFLKQYVLNQKPEDVLSTRNHYQNTIQPEEQATSFVQAVPQHQSVLNQNYVPNQISVLNQQDIPEKYPVPRPNVLVSPHLADVQFIHSGQAHVKINELIKHPKTHRMFLNMARAHNIANNPQKALYQILPMFKNSPTHTQMIIQKPSTVLLDKNTLLLPVPNKHIHQAVHQFT